MPFASISMASAAGFLGRPGIVITLPVSATINPAPADILISLIVVVKPSGLPKAFGSSERDYWFLAIHTGKWLSPKLLILAIAFLAFGSI